MKSDPMVVLMERSGGRQELDSSVPIIDYTLLCVHTNKVTKLSVCKKVRMNIKNKVLMGAGKPCPSTNAFILLVFSRLIYYLRRRSGSVGLSAR